MFSRPGALYVGRSAIPGEVRLRRDRLSIVSHDRERTVGTIEQDYHFDDVAAVSLTSPSLLRPRRTLRFDMLDGSVEHVWVSEWSDSFEQLDGAFRTYREEHPAPESTRPASRSTIAGADRLRGDGALVTWPMALVALVAFALNLTPRTSATGWAGSALFLGLLAATVVRWLRRRRRRRAALLDSGG